MPIIDVKQLRKTYTFHKKAPGLANSVKSLFKREQLTTVAVKDISFTVEEGELVGFLGPNGAGKTTTLKMLAGILYPSAGQATVLGFTPWERKAAYQKQFSIVMGQKNQLWWDLPAMESFLLNKEIYEVPDAQFSNTIEELTTLLDLKDVLDVQVRKLSLGQRMKAELTAALLHNPKVLFLDEPTIGLDVVSQLKMREFIRTYNQTKRTTIILTSHYMEDVVALAKRVIIIDRGVIFYDGPLAGLTQQVNETKTVRVTFTQDVARTTIEQFGTVIESTPRTATLRVERRSAAAKLADMLKALPVDDITVEEEPIDDIIRQVFLNNVTPA
ncbi:MAG: ATP-binding cassette domain-containing protein [Candidatus Kerfeldbacteria bacterium]|nr:ATP-binding cassette domain-containing protein [Candidatus Kerfeldbacteria bacterium]